MDRTAEISNKTERIVRILADQNLGGALVKSRHNFSWLTAGGDNGIDLASEAGSCTLLVRQDGKRFVLANRIEMPRLLAEELSLQEFEPVEFSWEKEKGSPTFVSDLAVSLLDSKGILGSDTPIDSRFPVVEAALASCRYQLTSAEISRFRSLSQDAGAALGKLVRNLQPGQSEQEVARQVAGVLSNYEITAVVNLVAADERIEKFRHPVPTIHPWTKVLMVVVCARRKGLTASLTRLISVGPVSDELRRRTFVSARVNAELLAATRPGVTGADLYRLAADTYAEEGFEGEEQRHHQGGACGYRTRDWVAHPKNQETVQPNQAFAWNPSVTGSKVEETCIAFDSEVEVISRSPGWPQISIEIDGREYLSPDVLRV